MPTSKIINNQKTSHLSPLISHFSPLTSHLSLLIFISLGFALRLHYLTTSHPFFDEYISVLAARQITEYGWPRLPSGLFYEHGLLATYLMTPFTAMFIHSPRDQWQAAQWGLMLARWPSLLVSTFTIPVIFVMGRRAWRNPQPALFAAALFALSPEGMVWGGRARMYALATLLVLITVYFTYLSLTQPHYRWYALLALAATLLTQFGALVLIPPLLIAWGVGELGIRNWELGIKTFKFLIPNSQFLLLILIIIGSIFIKRLGQPLGKPALNSPDSSDISSELITTVTYQTSFSLNWADSEKFLARQFGVPHLYWLTLITILSLVIMASVWLYHFATKFLPRPYRFLKPIRSAPNSLPLNPFTMFLLITFGLIILQALTLLDSSRRNPRYFVMYLPLFYLLAAQLSYQLVSLSANQSTSHLSLLTSHFSLLIIPYSLLILPSLRLALDTPEPAYEQAFAYVHANWQPGDVLLTMNSPAAALYLGHVDGFTAEFQSDQFLLNRDTAPIDRWAGAPWLGTVTEFNTVLNRHARVWYVTDSIRQPVYFGGSWQALLTRQFDQLWAHDNAFVYLTHPDRQPLPNQPDQTLNAQFGSTIQLTGYSQRRQTNQLQLTLFWQTLAPMPTDYTVFVHLRNAEGVTVAQLDRQPLDGSYPTSHWRVGETLIDPLIMTLPTNLPPNHYQLFIGLYQLDTLARLPLAHDTSGENAINLEIRGEK